MTLLQLGEMVYGSAKGGTTLSWYLVQGGSGIVINGQVVAK